MVEFVIAGLCVCVGEGLLIWMLISETKHLNNTDNFKKKCEIEKYLSYMDDLDYKISTDEVIDIYCLTYDEIRGRNKKLKTALKKFEIS